MHLTNIHHTTTMKFAISRTGFWYNSLTCGAFLISSGTYMLIVRKLGPHDFGIYAFVQWLAMVTLPMIGTGMSTLANRHVVALQSRQSPNFVAGIFYFLWYRQYRNIFLYGLFYLLLAFPLSWIFTTFTPFLLLLAVLSMLPVILSNVAGTTLRSLQRSDLLLMLHLFGALLTLLFTVVVAQIHDKQRELFLLASALSGTLTLAMALICIQRLLPLREAQQPGPFLKKLLARGLHYSPLAFAIDVIVWQYSSLLLLMHLPSEAGFFAISAFICNSIMRIAPGVLSSTFAKMFIAYLPGYPHRSEYDAFFKTSCYLALLTIPICLLVMAFSPIIITYCFGVIYLPLVTPLRILLIAAAAGSIATASSTYLANHECKHTQQWFGLGAALLHIILAWPCITLWGATGAAIACTIAQVASAMSSILICQKLLHSNKTTLRANEVVML